MGIETRLNALLKSATPKQKTDLYTSYHRLIDKNQMGVTYKAFAISDSQFEEPPVGF